MSAADPEPTGKAAVTGGVAGLLLALSMFSVVPVRARSNRPEPAAAASALRWLPALGVLLALLAMLPGLAVWRGAGHGSALLAAALAVSALELLTRGLHLDGLADLADGLGSRRPAAQALAVMGQPDIGAFGVAALLGNLLLQVSALSAILAAGSIPAGLVALPAAAGAGRLAVLLAAGTGIRAARPGGFGALVAGSAGLPTRLVGGVAVLAAAGLARALTGGDPVDVAWLLAAMLLGLAAGWLVRVHAVRRLGGVTGDVFGALVELTGTVVLVALAAELAWR